MDSSSYFALSFPFSFLWQDMLFFFFIFILLARNTHLTVSMVKRSGTRVARQVFLILCRRVSLTTHHYRVPPRVIYWCGCCDLVDWSWRVMYVTINFICMAYVTLCCNAWRHQSRRTTRVKGLLELISHTVTFSLFNTTTRVYNTMNRRVCRFS